MKNASVVVGVDFGPKFSGFAFASKSKPDEVYKFYEWPHVNAAGGEYSCKTSTTLLYDTTYSSGPFVFEDWGYSALVKYARGNKSRLHEEGLFGEATCGAPIVVPAPVEDSAWRTGTCFLSLFKIYVLGGSCRSFAAATLPEGLTVRRVISDYLRNFSRFIMRILQQIVGSHLTMEDVLWCLTVPANWDASLKEEMKICVSVAGMTKSPECPQDSMHTASPHPLLIMIEQEAASYYLQRKIGTLTSIDNKFLVVDIAGGNVDLVLHKKADTGSGRLEVQSLARSSGGLFGESLIDKAFFYFLCGKISCFRTFAKAHTAYFERLKTEWKIIKYAFDGDINFGPYEVELPATLACAWKELESSKNTPPGVPAFYFSVHLSTDDMLGLFDPVVNDILRLIQSSMISNGLLKHIESNPSEKVKLRALMVYGRFSRSEYLMKRLREQFSARVEAVVGPGDPECVLCCGAVKCGIDRVRG